MRIVIQLLFSLGLLGGVFAAEPSKRTDLEAALEKLELPHIKINLEERSVDVASVVCLDEGMLELVACTKDTKEHESIVAVKARPMHVHTALLLLGAKPGTPAALKLVDEVEDRWVHLPPSGGGVEVSLVWKDKAGKVSERPISDFIAPADPAGREKEAAKQKKFPTNTFLFAGSQLVAVDKGPRKYLSDQSGNVISIATFGDEVLCLPEVHSHQNGALVWQVDKTHLPAVNSEVILRLRPKKPSKDEAQKGAK